MFYKFMLMSSDDGGGQGGDGGNAGANNGAGDNSGGQNGGKPAPPVDDKIYTAKDLEEAKRRSYSSGLNETRKRDIIPLVNKAKEAGFDIDDLNEESFGSIIGLAAVGKKSETYSQQAKKQVDELQAKHNDFVGRYHTKVINAALSPFLKDAIDEQDTLHLIGQAMKFKVVEVDGKEVVKVVDNEGNALRKDGFTDMTLEEAVQGFLSKKPHLIQPSSRTPQPGTGSSSRGGVVIDARSLEEVIAKDNKTWTEADKKLVYKGLTEGKLTYVGREIHVKK